MGWAATFSAFIFLAGAITTSYMAQLSFEHTFLVDEEEQGNWRYLDWVLLPTAVLTLAAGALSVALGMVVLYKRLRR